MGLLETYFYQVLAALFFSGILLFRQLKKSRSSNPKGLPLPPGPKGYPVIGSLFDMPLDKPWLVYDEWRKIYGKSLIIDALLLQRFNLFLKVIWYISMSLARTFWFCAPWNGPLICSRKGLQITRTECDYLCWLSCMYHFSCISSLVKRNLNVVSEWNGILTWAFCPTACGGENTGDHFTIFLTLTRCPNTNLFKDGKSMPFYADCLTHPIISSTTFDSKYFTHSMISRMIIKWSGNKQFRGYYNGHCIWNRSSRVWRSVYLTCWRSHQRG